MRLALAESRRALPGCAPNPPVGCVIVSGGELLATGFTSPPGLPHAEVMALRALAGSPSGVTVYVTLEPCSFEGRTPSCAKALVAAGVGRVFVGIVDPDPRNQGRGIEILKAVGIPVDVGVLEDEIEELISPYLIRS